MNVHHLCLCGTRCLGNKRSSFGRGGVHSYLMLSGFRFVLSGLSTGRKAAAVVGKTMEESIYCVPIREELSLVTSAVLSGRALPCLQSCWSLAMLLVR